MSEDFATRVEGISALAEPARRALYLYVVRQATPVSREQAADGVGLPRHTAKFHLDKLVDEGLLDTEYRRLSGRSGPGAGRPAKLYRRSERQVQVSLPERQYQLAGEILATALEAAARAMTVPAAVEQAAEEEGRRIGAQVRTAGEAPEGAAEVDALAEVLASHGYEPRINGGRVELADCPFHALSRQHTELVCGMNKSLISALADELGYDDLDIRLEPAENRCCVTLATRA